MHSNSTIKTLSIVSSCMLAIALGDLPYGYYMSLKIAVCATFVVLAITLNEKGIATWTIAAWAFATLYNPIFRIPFNKDTWSVINLLTIAAIWLVYRKARVSDATKP